MRLLALLAAALVLLAAPAQAGGAKSDSAKKSGPSNRVQASFSLEPEEPHEAPAESDAGAGRSVDIPTLALPAFADGELKTYLFVSVRLHLADGVDPWKLRARAHYVRDAMIRAGHRRSVARADDPRKLDEELARDILLQGASRVIDLKDVARIEFLSVDSKAS